MKLKIDNESLAQEFFEHTKLLGIVAPVKDYLFSWHVNQFTGFSMRLNHGLEIQLRKKNRDYFFSVYEYFVPHSSLIHYLYKNQDDGEYLLPEFKHLDYLWLIKGEEFDSADLAALQKTIRLIPGVQLVNEMTNEKIKNKQHLIL